MRALSRGVLRLSRRASELSRTAAPTSRRYCTEQPSLVVSREEDGMATVSLRSKPVNSLTQAMCEELKARLGIQ